MLYFLFLCFVRERRFIFLAVEKLPDFADEKFEEEDGDEDKDKEDEDVDEAGDEPAGHDRQDSTPSDDVKNKPLTTEQDDQEPNDKAEDEGTEFDGLQVGSSSMRCWGVNHEVNGLVRY